MKLCPVCQRCYDDADNVCPLDDAGLLPSRPGPRLIADKYELERLLGRGGMGAVYAGRHVDLERPAAIKLLLPDLMADADALERFRREARAAACLNHPNVADTYDYGLLPDGGAYIVMELVLGQTLREYMNALGPLPLVEALNLASQIADGIEAAHAQGIVHRDLKPSNIVIGRDRAERLQAKVVDFGVAKLKEQTTSARGGLTSSGSLIGTPRYMSPEQCSGHAIDARSDIYSLGVILFEMLTGRPPFEAPSATAIAIKHIQEPPPPLKEFRPDLPDDLEQLMSQVLSKDPAARPQTAAELSNRLQEVARSLDHSETLPSDATASANRDAQTSRQDVSPPTSPPGVGAVQETGRTNHPTLESSLGAQEIEDGPSVPAYVTSPETKTELPVEISEPPSHHELVRLPETPVTDSQAKPSIESREPQQEHPSREWQRRSSFIIYAVLIAVIIISAGVIFGFLWPALRQHNSGQNATTTETPASPTQTGSVNSTASPAAGVSNTSERASQAGNSNFRPAPSPRATEPRAELRALLNDWLAATNARDVNRQMAFYAPTLDAYYLQHNTPRNAVRAEKMRIFNQINSVNVNTSEPEISVSDDGQAATMRFRKSWNFTGAQSSNGEVMQELRWRRTDAGWKIVSERDLQVLR